MKKSYVKDMTRGNEFSLLVSFSVPMLIGNLFQQFYNLVDSMIVGRYVGADALAAVGATGSLNYLFFSLCVGLTGGIGVVISQYFGAEDEENVRKTIFNSIYLIASSGIIMSLLGVFLARPVLMLLNTPANILEDAVSYMRIASAGLLAVASYNCISAILRALGDSKTPLFFLMVASLVNIIMDLILVIRFGLGVKGVAYATILSQIISATGSILFAIRKNPYFAINRQEMHFNFGIARKCCRIGIPLAFQSSLIAFSCVALQGVVNKFGSVVVAAFTATSRIEQLVQQPFNSLAMALSTFTGQNMGAGKMERVKRAFHRSVVTIGVFSAVMLLIFYTTGNTIMRFFVTDAQVIDFGTRAFRITAWFYFPLGMIYIVRGLLNGAGDAVYSLINGVVEVTGRLVFSNTLILIPPVGKWGVWLATALTWFITGIASIIRYKQGKWKTIRIVDGPDRKEEQTWNSSKESPLRLFRRQEHLKDHRLTKASTN